MHFIHGLIVGQAILLGLLISHALKNDKKIDILDSKIEAIQYSLNEIKKEAF